MPPISLLAKFGWEDLHPAHLCPPTPSPPQGPRLAAPPPQPCPLHRRRRTQTATSPTSAPWQGRPGSCLWTTISPHATGICAGDGQLTQMPGITTAKSTLGQRGQLNASAGRCVGLGWSMATRAHFQRNFTSIAYMCVLSCGRPRRYPHPASRHRQTAAPPPPPQVAVRRTWSRQAWPGHQGWGLRVEAGIVSGPWLGRDRAEVRLPLLYAWHARLFNGMAHHPCVND